MTPRQKAEAEWRVSLKTHAQAVRELVAAAEAMNTALKNDLKHKDDSPYCAVCGALLRLGNALTYLSGAAEHSKRALEAIQ